ncbi:acyltransferase [Photobacterium sp. GB-72]|nr:acyltransferase [Photobacterium sp. GB-56]PSV29604.1 acyltransferase [Photobacterium sp. GB-72]PSV43205.1 acyltransferase [Photobacterium sp. GB-36]PSV51991.1 acyltransferase [Photobacterium sp. GB-1]PSV55896.1 acyltransferase [Photobacterium sp. GB-3]
MVKNNFDVLRIFLAVLVFYFHIGIETQNEYLMYVPGGLAVHCFFVISGYLIVKSYLKRKSLSTYVKSRFLRIYPLYFIVITTAFIFGYFHYSGSFIDDINNGAGKYLASNYVFANFLHPTLPGLFENNFQPFVNAALWTIKIEVMFYICVPIIYGVLNKKLDNKKLTILLGLVSICCFYTVQYFIEYHGLPASINRQLPSMLVFFMLGAYWNFAEPKFLRLWHLLILIPIVFFLQSWFVIYAFAVSFIVYVIVFKLKPIAVSKRIGDISYGIYIWHFPILQTLIMYGFFKNIYQGTAIATVLVFSFAMISWHFIESKLVVRH